MRKWLSLLLLCPFAAFAQYSQVNGNISAGLTINLASTNNPLIPGALKVQASPLFQSVINLLTNGTGANNANQIYAAQWLITNGALTGTNWLNVHAPTVNDSLGNPFALTQCKAIIIQNLGAALSTYGSYETNILQVQEPGTTLAWTNFLGACNVTNYGLTIYGPSTNAQTGLINYHTFMSVDLGDVGIPVGGTTNNTLILTNPVGGSTPIAVNVWIVGSTGQ